MGNGTGDVTKLLRQWRAGESQAESELFKSLLPDLRKIAGHCFRGERSSHTLQPTALVNEAFVRLARAKNIEWHDRGHFFALAARIMRRYLIDHARKQPSVHFMPMEGFPERALGRRTPLELAMTVDELLEELGKESPQRRAVVELKFFLGMTDEEAAEALGLKLHTFQREWHRARQWLYHRMMADHANQP